MSSHHLAEAERLADRILVIHDNGGQVRHDEAVGLARAVMVAIETMRRAERESGEPSSVGPQIRRARG